MSFSLITAYPLWLSIICLVTGMGYATILYFRNKNNGFHKRMVIFMAILRTLSVSLISFLLLSPLLKSTFRHTEKPIVVVALDQSESIAVGKDSLYYKNTFLPGISQLAENLGKKYEVVTYSIAGDIQTQFSSDFKGKETNLGNLFPQLRNRYSNRNLAALVLASDGIITKGADPIFMAEKADYPIYTVALGDTVQRRDLLVARVNYNQIAYLGNQFPIEIMVVGHKCHGSATRLSVSSEGTEVYNKELLIGGHTYSLRIPVMLTASRPGIQRVRIALSPVENEKTISNNYKEIFIEVLDGRQKILLLAASPHPDIAAIKAAVEQNINYDIEQKYLSEFDGSFSKYNLVILHQIPSAQDAASQVLSGLKESKLPVLYLIGTQTNITAFNALQEGIYIPPSTVSFSAAYPIMNTSFHQFSISPEIESRLAEFPPLNVPFGQFKTSPSTDALLFEKIGSVSTTVPLISFNQGLDRKSAVIAGEGLWRWRLANFMNAGNHLAFDEIINKSVQFLALKSDKSQFRILTKSSYLESEAVEINAELYNESFELINDADVNITIESKDGRNFPFMFTRSMNGYYLDAGSFPPGEYSFKASALVGGKTLHKSGRFNIISVDDELINTVANHSMLYTLAKQHGGEMVGPSDLAKIQDMLESREDIKTVVYSEKKYTDLVNLFQVLALILLLLSLEWFLRKRNGGY